MSKLKTEERLFEEFVEEIGDLLLGALEVLDKKIEKGSF